MFWRAVVVDLVIAGETQGPCAAGEGRQRLRGEVRAIGIVLVGKRNKTRPRGRQGKVPVAGNSGAQRVYDQFAAMLTGGVFDEATGCRGHDNDAAGQVLAAQGGQTAGKKRRIAKGEDDKGVLV